MKKRTLVIDRLSWMRNARTLHELWTGINNDQHRQFQQFYHDVTGKIAERYDESPDGALGIKETLDSLERSLAIFNQILSLEEGDRDADIRRCDAVADLLLDVLQAKDRKGVPLKTAALALVRSIASVIVHPEEADKSLIVISGD